DFGCGLSRHVMQVKAIDTVVGICLPHAAGAIVEKFLGAVSAYGVGNALAGDFTKRIEDRRPRYDDVGGPHGLRFDDACLMTQLVVVIHGPRRVSGGVRGDAGMPGVVYALPFLRDIAARVIGNIVVAARRVLRIDSVVELVVKNSRRSKVAALSKLHRLRGL